MNKKEFIEQEINKNKNAFGRWHSKNKKNSADRFTIDSPLIEDPPKNELESIQYGNALANTGNYPIGLSGCFCVGISGGCGPDCYVFKEGSCEEPGEDW